MDVGMWWWGHYLPSYPPTHPPPDTLTPSCLSGAPGHHQRHHHVPAQRHLGQDAEAGPPGLGGGRPGGGARGGTEAGPSGLGGGLWGGALPGGYRSGATWPRGLGLWGGARGFPAASANVSP